MDIKDMIVWGGIYQASSKNRKFDALVRKTASEGWERDYRHPVNDQKNHVFFPVCYNGNYYMVDTYMLGFSYGFPSRGGEGNGDKKTPIEKYADGFALFADPEYGKWVLCQMNFAFKNYFRIDEESIGAFELICDLHDYEIIRGSDAPKYRKEDVVEDVSLWEECNYPYGFTLHKKGGPIDWRRRISNYICNDIRFGRPDPQEYEIAELKELIAQSGGDYDRDFADEQIAVHEFLRKQLMEFDNFVDGLPKKEERK